MDGKLTGPDDIKTNGTTEKGLIKAINKMMLLQYLRDDWSVEGEIAVVIVKKLHRNTTQKFQRNWSGSVAVDGIETL